MSHTAATEKILAERKIPRNPNAEKYEAKIYSHIANRKTTDQFTVDVFCINAARMADREIGMLKNELERLQTELNFARAANRQHVRDLTDARNENDRLRSGGLAIAL